MFSQSTSEAPAKPAKPPAKAMTPIMLGLTEMPVYFAAIGLRPTASI